MNIAQLIEQLQGLDPRATVFVYVDEEAERLRFIRTDGDDLYFKSDPAHRPGTSHVYLCDYTGGDDLHG